MTVELGVIISVVSVGVAILSLVMNGKKANKNDGFELGNFMGEMKSEIKSIKSFIEELKRDNREVDEKIAKAIHEHEVHYDDKISKMMTDHELRYHNH